MAISADYRASNTHDQQAILDELRIWKTKRRQEWKVQYVQHNDPYLNSKSWYDGQLHVFLNRKWAKEENIAALVSPSLEMSNSARNSIHSG